MEPAVSCRVRCDMKHPHANDVSPGVDACMISNE